MGPVALGWQRFVRPGQGRAICGSITVGFNPRLFTVGPVRAARELFDKLGDAAESGVVGKGPSFRARLAQGRFTTKRNGMTTFLIYDLRFTIGLAEPGLLRKRIGLFHAKPRRQAGEC